jgi:hypothetical protein
MTLRRAGVRRVLRQGHRQSRRLPLVGAEEGEPRRGAERELEVQIIINGFVGDRESVCWSADCCLPCKLQG